MLDIVDVFARKQPTSPLVLRLIIPLVELVLNSPTSEAHLSSKATGILQGRICKSKDVIVVADRAEAVEVLTELHAAARKAQNAAVARTCSQCSVVVARALLHATPADAQPVLDVYLASLDDFMTKKTTKVRAALFTDFVARFPVAAWSMRERLVQYAESDGANAYRQTQAFNILNELITQIPNLVRVRRTLASPS